MNKIMQRPFMGQMIRQRTDNQFLSVTDLMNSYELIRNENDWVKKDAWEFFNNSSEIEYITELLNLIKPTFVGFTELVKNKGIIQAMKIAGIYEVKGRGGNKSVFCDPYIFVALAQWLNPYIRAKVTMWVTDSLILNRIEAGHGFSRLTSAITEYIVPALSDNGKKFIYSNFAKLLNIKVFGKHDSELRQLASKEQLAKMRDIETELATLIKVGHITDYHGAKEYLSK